MITLSIAREFSPTPGPRFENEGSHSGQEFREKLLRPKWLAAQAAGDAAKAAGDATKEAADKAAAAAKEAAAPKK